MRTFTDRIGQTWRMYLDELTIRRIQLLLGVDVTKPGSLATLFDLVQDDKKLATFIVAFLRPIHGAKFKPSSIEAVERMAGAAFEMLESYQAALFAEQE